MAVGVRTPSALEATRLVPDVVPRKHLGYETQLLCSTLPRYRIQFSIGLTNCIFYFSVYFTCDDKTIRLTVAVQVV